MIAFLRGRVIRVEPNVAVVDVHGVGYKVNVTSACASKLSGIDENILIHTHMIVREDDIQLYGFIAPEEITVFLLLIGVNGVGPRVALAILSFLTPQGLGRALAHEDILAFTKVPGIGKKIAQRIILELKEKFDNINIGIDFTDSVRQTEENNQPQAAEDAVAVMISLGYNNGEARDALRRATREKGEIKEVSELVKTALQYLDNAKQ